MATQIEKSSTTNHAAIVAQQVEKEIDKRDQAARLLASGYSLPATAHVLNLPVRVLHSWQARPEFASILSQHRGKVRRRI